MSSFELKELRHLSIEIIDGDRGLHYPPKTEFTTSGFCLFLNTGNVTPSGFDFSDLDFIGEKRDFLLKKGKLRRYDIVLTTRGTVGNVGFFDENVLHDNIRINSGMVILRTNRNEIDPYYLYSFLKSGLFRKQVKSHGSGSAQPQLPISSLRNISLPIFDLATQKKIAASLSALDSKIELNSRINAELEATAKTLYEYWFVQFDFPDQDGKPYKSSGGKMAWNDELKREIPHSWELRNLFVAMDVQYGFPFDTTKFTDDTTQKPVVRIRDILENTISTYSVEGVHEKHRLNKNDLLIGMDGNFHLNFWDKEGAYLNQRCVRIRSKTDSEISTFQTYFELAPHIKARENNISRTTVGHLSDKDLKRLFLLQPFKTSSFKPRETFDSLLSKIISNRLENQQLAELRDWLLPMLMNGQVTVGD